ncbi:hypothetical protein LINPERHAP1_LOCUS41055 [Linum perenne]
MVEEGGPWSFDKSLLVLHTLKPGENPQSAPLYTADFWIHICGLTPELYSEIVGRPFMRIRVRLDIRKSLKREKPLRKSGKEIVVSFQYERLPNFCYICGRMGHIDRYYEVRFRVPGN